MPLAELMSQIQELPKIDKLRLMQFLAAELIEQEDANFRPLVTTKQLRPFGLCAGEFTVPDDFDAPLQEDMLNAFEGK